MIRMKSRLFLRHNKLCKIKPDALWGKLTDVRTKKYVISLPAFSRVLLYCFFVSEIPVLTLNKRGVSFLLVPSYSNQKKKKHLHLMNRSDQKPFYVSI